MSGPGVDAPASPLAPPAPIDPRIRARRIAVRRDQGRRRLRRLVAGVAAVAVAVAGWGLTRSPLLDVDRVTVAGATRTATADVVGAAAVEPGDAMVDVDLDAAVARVEALPWVASARAERSWPGTVELRITERVPAAVVPAGGGGWAVVDDEGRVLEGVADPGPALVRVEGVPEAGAPGTPVSAGAREVLGVLRRMPAALADHVRTVRVVDGGLELDLGPVAAPDQPEPPRAVVRFGPATQVGEKAVALLAVLERVELAGVAVLDVRVPTAPALTRRDRGA